MRRERQAGTGEEGVNSGWREKGGVNWPCVRKCFRPPFPGDSLDPVAALFGGSRRSDGC